jgi:hypothetical protein
MQSHYIDARREQMPLTKTQQELLERLGNLKANLNDLTGVKWEISITNVNNPKKDFNPQEIHIEVRTEAINLFNSEEKAKIASKTIGKIVKSQKFTANKLPDIILAPELSMNSENRFGVVIFNASISEKELANLSNKKVKISHNDAMKQAFSFAVYNTDKCSPNNSVQEQKSFKSESKIPVKKELEPAIDKLAFSTRITTTTESKLLDILKNITGSEEFNIKKGNSGRYIVEPNKLKEYDSLKGSYLKNKDPVVSFSNIDNSVTFISELAIHKLHDELFPKEKEIEGGSYAKKAQDEKKTNGRWGPF